MQDHEACCNERLMDLTAYQVRLNKSLIDLDWQVSTLLRLCSLCSKEHHRSVHRVSLDFEASVS